MNRSIRKCVLVTGFAQGLDKAIAEKFIDSKFSVIRFDIQDPKIFDHKYKKNQRHTIKLI